MSGNTVSLYSYTKKGIWWKVLISSILLVGIGAINGLWTLMDYKEWYASLEKPFFSPPSSQVVGMIWTLFYIIMGVSVGIIWQIAKKAIGLFIIQIAVNMIVPIFFFAFHNLYLLLFSVSINLLFVATLIQRFYRINKTAAIILIPYLMWLVYATLLDASLLWLNAAKI